MRKLEGKTAYVTGGGRGIGREVVLKLAQDGANVVVNDLDADVAHAVADEARSCGVRALAVPGSVSDGDFGDRFVGAGVEAFGGIDIVVNNASAIQLTGTLQTEMKRYDLMQGVNARGTFLVSKTCIPHLKQAQNPHILTLSPPLDMKAKWFAPHVAYTISKYGMSLCVLGMAGEFRGRVGVNALWPRAAIATAAITQFEGSRYDLDKLRSPEIMADAAYLAVTSDARTTTGNFWVDDALLASHGVTDLSRYAPEGVSDAELSPDIFVPSLAELASS